MTGRAAQAAIRALRGHEPLAIAVVLSALSMGGLEAAGLFLVLPQIQSFRADDPVVLERLGATLWLVAGVVVLRAATGYVNEVLGARLQVKVLVSLRESLVEAFYRTRHDVLRAMGAGKPVNLFSTQVERIVTAIGALGSLVTALVLLAVYATAMLAVSVPLTAVGVGVGFAGFVVARVLAAGIRRHAERLTTAQDESARLVVDDIDGMHVIQAFAAGSARLERHRAANRALLAEAFQVHRWTAAVGPLTAALYALMLIGALLVAIASAPGAVLGNLPLLAAFGVILLRAHGQLAGVADAWATLAEQEGAAASLHVVSSAPSADPADGRAVPGIERLQLQGVEFGYSREPVLRGLDLELHRGELLALVGASGSGKSTLAALLVRLRSPASGRILLDRMPLGDAARGDLARRIGIVFQDGFVFDESVRWNVTLGREATPQALASAIGAAGLENFLDAPARGLSGGERQRVALARALLGAPDVLVLDEATSALDAAAERAVLDAVKPLRGDRITLLIAHRLSTVLAADRVALLNGGRIVAAGSHEELLERSAEYRSLVETQLVDRLTV